MIFWIFYGDDGGDDGGDDDDDGDDGPKSAFSNFVPYHQLSAIFGYFTIEYVYNEGLNLNLLYGSKCSFEGGSEGLNTLGSLRKRRF